MDDLISRKALFKAWDGLSDEIKDKDLLIDEMIRRTQDAEAVDAEPVRHGTWVQSRVIPSFHHCSYCKAAFEMKATCNTYALFNYCPNCGARMDKED